MDIGFANKRLEDLSTDDKLARRELGKPGSDKLRRRLDDMDAAATLEAMRHLPGRCHELKGDWAGQLALDLDKGRRLVFRPTNDPPPVKPDGGLDWDQVTSIEVTAIVDYHD